MSSFSGSNDRMSGFPGSNDRMSGFSECTDRMLDFPGSRRPLTGAERARRYRERKKLKKLYEALLGGSPRREQLTVQL